MTDTQIVQRCAAAMKYVLDVWPDGSLWFPADGNVHAKRYDPLRDAAHCADLEHWLLQHGSIYMNAREWEFYNRATTKFVTQKEISTIEERRRAICETVSAIYQATPA